MEWNRLKPPTTQSKEVGGHPFPRKLGFLRPIDHPDKKGNFVQRPRRDTAKRSVERWNGDQKGPGSARQLHKRKGGGENLRSTKFELLKDKNKQRDSKEGWGFIKMGVAKGVRISSS